MTKQTVEGNKLPPTSFTKNAQGALVLRYRTVYFLTDNQSLEEESPRTHIHIPQTLLESDSLIHCCHGNPIKGGHSGCKCGEISLSLFYLFSLFLSHTHTHTFLFSHFLPSHFYLSPSITFSSSPIVLLLLSLHHPWCTSLPVSLHYCATFSSSHLPPPTSKANVNMSSNSNPHCIHVSDFCLVSTHTS